MKHDRKPPVAAPAGAAVSIPGALQAPEAPAPLSKPRGRTRAILGLAAVTLLAGGGYVAQDWWTTGRFMVSTDDAYVDADITLISSRVQGYVTDLPVVANAHVRAGDVLVRLDDGDYRLALETARSRVATADQTLARIDAQILAAQAGVAQAQAGRDAVAAQLTNAQANFARVKDLTDRKVAAQAQLDAATEQLDTATATLAKAAAAVTSAEAEIAVLRAQRAEAEGHRQELALAVTQAQRDLDLTVLRAPADGTLANLALEKGDLVAPGARLAALVADDGYYVEANFKETQMPGVSPGAAVHLRFDALPGREFEGVVTSVAPATGSVFSLLPAENATGNFTKVVQRVPVRIAIPSDALATGDLRAGLSVEVGVDTRSTSGAARHLAAAD